MSSATIWNASTYGSPPSAANVRTANALIKLGGPKRKNMRKSSKNNRKTTRKNNRRRSTRRRR